MFVFGVAPAVIQTTHATPNTEIDCLFLKPGTGRTMSILAFYLHGKAAGLAALSAISLRLRSWTATASSAGTAVTPAPSDGTVQAAKTTAGYGTTAGVTSGTTAGGTRMAIGCGVSGQAGWVAPNADAMPNLEGSANKSWDLFSVSPTASLNFESTVEVVE